MNFSSGWREIKKTRKDHRCWGCAEVIPSGSHAWYEAGKYDGDFYADYYCDKCKSFWKTERVGTEEWRHKYFGAEWPKAEGDGNDA